MIEEAADVPRLLGIHNEEGVLAEVSLEVELAVVVSVPTTPSSSSLPRPPSLHLLLVGVHLIVQRRRDVVIHGHGAYELLLRGSGHVDANSFHNRSSVALGPNALVLVVVDEVDALLV